MLEVLEFLGTEKNKVTLKENKIDKIIDYLQKINPNKLTGSDDLSLKVLKEVSYEIAFPSSKLLNR